MSVFSIGLLVLPPVAAAEIPAAFRANWAPTLADCRDIDAIYIMTIDRHTIGFYEGRTERSDFRIAPVSPRRIRIHTVIDSAGERSPAILDLEISKNRQALAWSGFGRDPQIKEHYVRCPS